MILQICMIGQKSICRLLLIDNECLNYCGAGSSLRYLATSRSPPPLCSGHGSIFTSTCEKPSFSNILVLAGLAV